MKKYLVLSFVLILILFNQGVSEDIDRYNSESLYIYRDVGIIDILLPETVYVGTMVQPQAIIGNFGTCIEMVFVSIWWNSPGYVNTRMVVIQPGVTITIAFESVIANVPGIFVFNCSLGISDSNPTNNFRSETLVVLPLGIEEELPPIGTRQENKPTIMNVSDFKSEYQDKSVFIYEPSGRLVNLRNLKSGIYFLRITDKDKITTRKVMLIRE